ncbi:MULTISPECIES: glycosyltransferase [Sphingobacterium]|uniref:glycosyltransferase n=1 Tax=Sphingobacterium TaxID=28453 RepID=UPI0013D90E5F|nr:MULTISPECIES: glycosyltransferase [unclassified Sphingobacterium]
MKIQIILPDFPYPPNNGFRIKTYNLIDLLKLNHDIEVVVIKLNDKPVDARYFESYKIPIKLFKVGFFEKILNLFLAVFSFKPIQVHLYRSRAARKYIKKNGHRFDAYIFNMIRTSSYRDLVDQKKVIFDMVDLLSKSYAESLRTTSSFFYKVIYSLEINRLRKEEDDVCLKVGHVILVNKEESEMLSCVFDNITWIPNGVNKNLFEYGETPTIKNRIVFLGAMHYQPNIDAILWFDKYVIDKLNEKIELLIVGANPSKKILDIQNRRKNVKVLGFVDDPFTILKSSLVVIAPMQNGGGIQNKILESMALGTINIISSYAARPIIGGENDKHFIVEDKPNNLADIINKLSVGDLNLDYMKSEGKELIKNNYTWDNYIKKLNSILKNIQDD